MQTRPRVLRIVSIAVIVVTLVLGAERWYAGYRERKTSSDIQRLAEKINSIAPTSRAINVRARRLLLMTYREGPVDPWVKAGQAVMEKLDVTYDGLIGRLLVEIADLQEVVESFEQLKPTNDAEMPRVRMLHRHALRELAGAELAAGHEEKAAALYRRVASLYDRTSELRGWAASQHNLATTLVHCGRRVEALQLASEILKIRREAFGEFDLDTMTSLTTVALLVGDESSQTRFESALAISEKLKGRHDIETRIRANHLGELWRGWFDTQKAEDLFLWVLEDWKNKRDGIDSVALRAVDNMGALYRLSGKTSDAEALFLEALKDCEKAFGKDDAETLAVVDDLVFLCGVTDEYLKAAPLLERALESRLRVLGEAHAKTCWTAYWLAKNEVRQEKREKAIEHARQAYRGWLKSEGRQSKDKELAVALLRELGEEP